MFDLKNPRPGVLEAATDRSLGLSEKIARQAFEKTLIFSRWLVPARAERTLAVIGLITLFGTLLRIAAARGDLWLDEIWSFRLLERIGSPADIFVGLPNDNNHVLTTAWLDLVGPDAPSLLVRLPAIVFGSLCAPVAARIGARRGPVAAVAAAAIFAFDYGFVHYGSEARGYSGLILATLVAYDAMEDMFEKTAVRGAPIVFALAIMFGTFSHLTMLEPAALLCVVATLRLLKRGDWRLSALADSRPVLLAAAAGLSLPLACLGASLFSGSIHRGLVTPFSFDAFGEGLSRMARATIGLADGPIDPPSATVLLVVVATMTVAALMVLPSERRFFPAIAILGLPMLHAMAGLPNQQYPRFHLTAAIALALLCAEVWALSWRLEGTIRIAAAVTAITFFAGQVNNLARFLTQQRGHYAEATALMGQNGAATFAVSPRVQAGETGAVIRWYTLKLGSLPLVQTPLDDLCTQPPDWLVIVHLPKDREKPLDITAGQNGCTARFSDARVFPAYGLSGFSWVIYRRAAPGQVPKTQSSF